MAILEFYSDFLSEYLVNLRVWESEVFQWGNVPNNVRLGYIMASIRTMDADCVYHGLTHSAQQIARISEMTQTNSIQLSSAIHELRLRMEDELKARLLLIVDNPSQPYIVDPVKEFGEFIRKFSVAVFDVEEAGKSYALGRYTASVFHLQRVVETGLKALAVKLGKSFDRNSWESHLKDIERELEARYGAAPPRDEEGMFYAEAASQIGHVKHAWRNPTMHVDKTYIPEVALDIWNAVKAFMRHLSTRLP